MWPLQNYFNSSPIFIHTFHVKSVGGVYTLQSKDVSSFGVNPGRGLVLAGVSGIKLAKVREIEADAYYGLTIASEKTANDPVRHFLFTLSAAQSKPGAHLYVDAGRELMQPLVNGTLASTDLVFNVVDIETGKTTDKIDGYLSITILQIRAQ